MSAHRIRTRFYQQFDADFTREVPAEATGGWQSAELPIDWHRTALVVMHAWDCGTLEQFPGVFHPNEYLPRADAVCREVFPPLLTAARASPMQIFHVVGGGAYYHNLPGYLRAKLLAGEAGDRMESGAAEHIEQSSTVKELVRFRRDHVSPGAHNFDNAMAGRKVRDFPETARPHDDEGIAENAAQLFALCREHRIDHLVYVGFAINWCLLVSPGGMVDMGRHGLLCSTIPEAVTAVENKETARHELAKALALWRVALGFGFVYDLADFMAGLQGVALTPRTSEVPKAR